MNFEVKEKLYGEELFLVSDFKPIIGDEQKYKIKKVDKDEKPETFVTATPSFKDFIGNVTDVYPESQTASIRGVIHGTMQEVHDVRMLEELNRRVMITEHLRVNGKFELVATNNPILFRGINFVNFGWKNKKTNRRRFIRIDIYTGEQIYLEN